MWHAARERGRQSACSDVAHRADLACRMRHGPVRSPGMARRYRRALRARWGSAGPCPAARKGVAVAVG